MAEHVRAARRSLQRLGAAELEAFRSSGRSLRPVLDRDVGALLLLRDARAPRPVHDQVPLHGGRPEHMVGFAAIKGGSRPVFGPLAIQPLVVADLRALHRPRVPDAALRRHHRRPRARPAQDRGGGRHPDGDRPLRDGLRAALLRRPVLADHRQRRLQAQRLHPGRRALPARRSPPRRRLHHLLHGHQPGRVPATSSAARSAGGTAGTTASPPPASAWCSASSSTWAGSSTWPRTSSPAQGGGGRGRQAKKPDPEKQPLRKNGARSGRWSASAGSTSVFWAVYEQQGNTMQLWADEQTDWPNILSASRSRPLVPVLQPPSHPGLTPLSRVWRRQAAEGHRADERLQDGHRLFFILGSSS